MPVAILVVTLSLIGLAACGGDDDEGATPTEAATDANTTSKAEFIEQADALCQSFEEDQDDLEQRLSEWGESVSAESPNFQEGAELMRESADLVEDEVNELNQLTPPPDVQEMFDRYLSLGQQASAIFREVADAFEAGNSADAQALLDEAGSVADRGSRLFQGYGFEVCGAED
jgi:hypothetical protein